MAVPNLGELTALTRDYVENKLTDNIFKANPLLMKLRANEETFSGGENIRENLIYDDDSGDTTGASIARTQTINHVEREGVDAAQFPFAQYYQSVILWHKDLAANGRGDTRIFSIHDARMQTAELRFRSRLSRHLFATGTGTNNLLGLLDLFSTTNTYGSISRSAQTWWQPQIDGNGGTGRPLTLRLMDDTYHAISDGDIRPDLIIASAGLFAKYSSLLHAQPRFQDDNLANAGFTNILFNDVPIVKDKNVDTDSTTRHKMYFLNTKFLKWRPHEDWNFKVDDFREMEHGAGIYTRIWWYGNMTCNNCRYQGVINDLDPAL